MLPVQVALFGFHASTRTTPARPQIAQTNTPTLARLTTRVGFACRLFGTTPRENLFLTLSSMAVLFCYLKAALLWSQLASAPQHSPLGSALESHPRGRRLLGLANRRLRFMNLSRRAAAPTSGSPSRTLAATRHSQSAAANAVGLTPEIPAARMLVAGFALGFRSSASSPRCRCCPRSFPRAS